MENITALYMYLMSCHGYVVGQDLEAFEEANFNRVRIYYDYVDGEEGDSYKYEYYHQDNLVGYIENLGGDEFDGELTQYGKQIMFEQHMKACKKILELE